jgi:glyoxylase-like metal-dependent hydrolase (beta-lactamase superfamily II)
MHMSQWPFTRGLHDLGNGCFAYLQPDGTWGWSNAGLIESHGETLLVDTLMGLEITRAMLEEMRRLVPAAAHIGTLVNTHANPDHVLGNELVTGAEIISGKAAAEDISSMNPAAFERMARDWQQMGDGGEFFHETMGRQFDFSGVTIVPPTRTFERELASRVGDKEVRLVDLGPAHTRSDTIVHVPSDRTVFTGDLLFSEASPIMWAGPVQNWIDACAYLLELDVETIVPGHGPIADKSGVRAQMRYFEYLRAEARRRYEAGLTWDEAAADIALREFAHWPDAERIVANVCALYREFGARIPEASAGELFGAMGRWRKRRGKAAAGTAAGGP